MKLYKVLAGNGTACHGGHGAWNLPHGKRPGKWMPTIRSINPRIRGYHLVSRDQLIYCLGPAIFEAEGRGEHIKQDGKHVFGQARLICKMDTWTERAARLFACDCAEVVLPIYERKYQKEPAPRLAVETARRFANGEASAGELYAAWDAARDAAWGAAGAAARAAAGDAARAAAWDAAGGAAWVAEKKWQTKRLWEYLDGMLG